MNIEKLKQEIENITAAGYTTDFNGGCVDKLVPLWRVMEQLAKFEAAQVQPPNQGDTHHWPQQGDTTWPAQPVGVPAGWTIKRADKPPFKHISIRAPNGYQATVDSLAFNPENILYMLADALLDAAPSIPVDEKVQPLQEWHQHQCATNYFANAKCDCSVSAPAAKVELPVVAYLHFHKTDLMYSKSGQLSFTKFRDDQEPLVRLTDALAAIAAAQGEKP